MMQVQQEFNMDWKAECGQLNLTHVAETKMQKIRN